MVFCSQAGSFFVISTFILYDNGYLDELFWDNVDSLSFFEFNHYYDNRNGNSKDMQTVRAKDFFDTAWTAYHVAMVY
jgi:hypothetical protein